MSGYLLATILALSLVAYLVGLAQARRLAAKGPLRSSPAYYGAAVAIWVGIPALVLVLLWQLLEGGAIDALLWQSLPAGLTDGMSAAERELTLARVHGLAAGTIPPDPGSPLGAAAERLGRLSTLANLALLVVTLAVLGLGLILARLWLRPNFHARRHVEAFLDRAIVAASAVALLVSAGIVFSLAFEAVAFFRHVSPAEFFFGLRWEPQIAIRPDQIAAAGSFGAVPVFFGTVLISAIAMALAVPIGLLAAIYLAEFARPQTRRLLKPVLEVLAGVPTIVYGFFAVLVVAPAIRAAGAKLGLAVAPDSALAVGLVVGLMIVPFVSSLADDALRAVPDDLREASLSVGATHGETAIRVLLPAAMPGITGGLLLALSRTIGETMIVVMAAGLIATMTLNPLNSVTTVTVQIVSLLAGDAALDDPKTLAAFALGIVLFATTLAVNLIALGIVRRFRERHG